MAFLLSCSEYSCLFRALALSPSLCSLSFLLAHVTTTVVEHGQDQLKIILAQHSESRSPSQSQQCATSSATVQIHKQFPSICLNEAGKTRHSLPVEYPGQHWHWPSRKHIEGLQRIGYGLFFLRLFTQRFRSIELPGNRQAAWYRHVQTRWHVGSC